MRVLFGLIIGIAVGVAAVWYFSTHSGKSSSSAPGEHLEEATRSARDAIQEKLRVMDLRPEQIKEDLARTGKVVRRKAHEAGQAIADATADFRTTATIKTKLVANKDLSALSISVNTTQGIVTLSGTVSSPEDIGKAMLLAMETDGVTEVISTLQVKNNN